MKIPDYLTQVGIEDKTHPLARIACSMENSIKLNRTLQKEGSTEERRKFLLDTQLAELARMEIYLKRLVQQYYSQSAIED